MSSKLGVVTWHDDGFEYGGYFHEKNKANCDKFGHDFTTSSERKVPDLPPHWERIPMCIELLPKYDYLMWLDADAHLLDKDVSELTAYTTENLLIGKDADTQEEHHHINSGVFILRNTPWSFKFLEKWIELGPEASGKYRAHGLKVSPKKRYKFRDQGALRWMFLNNLENINIHALVLPYGELQHFSKPVSYVLHYAGPSGKRRLKKLYDSENSTSNVVHQ